MSGKALVGGLLSGFSQVFGKQIDDAHAEKQATRAADLRFRELIINSPDATPEDKQRALDEYMDIVQGKKPGTGAAAGGKGKADPTAHARDVIARAIQLPPPGSGDITQKPAIDFGTSLPELPARGAKKKTPAASFAPPAAVPASLPDLPARGGAAGGYQMDQRQRNAITGRQQDVDDATLDFERKKELEGMRFQHDLAVKAGKLTRTGTKMPGSAVPAQEDNFGEPIDRSGNAQYDVFTRPDGSTTFMRSIDKALSAPERVTSEKAQQLRAVDVAAGRAPKTDDEYMMQARVDTRLDEMSKRKERTGRYQQFLQTANTAIDLTKARTELDVERLKQLQAEFPATFALKQLNVDTAKAKLDLLGNPSPSALMQWADNQARILVTQKDSPYEGEDFIQTRDALLKEMGQDPVDLAAKIKERQAPKASVDTAPPVKRDPAMDNAQVRAKAKALLEGANKDASDKGIDAFLLKGSNLTNVKSVLGIK